jgi:hypothetical protein
MAPPRIKAVNRELQHEIVAHSFSKRFWRTKRLVPMRKIGRRRQAGFQIRLLNPKSFARRNGRASSLPDGTLMISDFMTFRLSRQCVAGRLIRTFDRNAKYHRFVRKAGL